VRKKNAKKLAKSIVTTAAVASSAVVVSNPAQAATTNNAEKLVTKAEKLAGALKWQVSYDYRKKVYPKKVLDYPNMKLFNDTKSALKAAREEVKKLKGKEKEIFEARLERVQVYVDRATRYIDAVSAGKKIEAKANLLKKLISNNIVNDSTETAYHDLSKEIRTKSPTFSKVYGASARKAFVETYVKPAQQVKDSALYPVSIKIATDRLNAALKENKIDQAIYHKNQIDKLVNGGLRLGVLKKNSNLFKSVIAYINPVKAEFEKRFVVYYANSTAADKPTTFGGTATEVKKYDQTVILIAGKDQVIKLENVEINGNIIIKGNKIGAGTVYLENVKVNKVSNQGGVIIVEDIADHSLHQKNVIAEELKINDANGANIVAEEGTKIKTLSLSDTAGSTGAVILESKEKGAYEVVSVGTKGSESSKGVELKGDFSNTKVEVTGEGSQVKVAKDAVVKEIEVKTEAKLEAEQGAKVQAVNLAAEKAGQKIELKGDLKEATVTVKNANAQIEVAKDSVVKEIKKDSSVTEPIQVTNSGTIQTSTGVTVNNKDGGQTGTQTGSTGSSAGSSPTGGGGVTADTTAPTVSLVSSNQVKIGDDIVVKVNELGTVYLVPNDKNPKSKAELDNLATVKVDVKEINSNIKILTSNLKAGDYKLYAVDNVGNISTPINLKAVLRNHAPTVEHGVADQQGTVGTPVSVDLTNVFADQDGDALTITADKGAIEGNTWSYTPVEEDAGKTITVTLTAEDEKGEKVTETFDVVVAVKKVKLADGSKGNAADQSITGLESGKKYKVTVGTTNPVVKYVRADGTLSDNEADAAELEGTEIKGLTNGETYKVEEIAEAPTIEVKLSPGFVLGSISIDYIPENGNNLVFKISNQPISTPKVGDAPPEDALPYNIGDDITNIEAGQYIQLYKLDDNNKIVKFAEIQITAEDINDSYKTRFAFESSSSNSLKVEFNHPLEDVTFENDDVNEVIKYFNITTEDNSINKSNITSIEWDRSDPTITRLVIHLDREIALLTNNIIYLGYAPETVKFISQEGNDAYHTAIYGMSEDASDSVIIKHIKALAEHSADVEQVHPVDDVLFYLSINSKIQNYNNHKAYVYQKLIAENSDKVTDLASLQNIINEANKIPTFDDVKAANNVVSLIFSENVWLDGTLDSNDIKVYVDGEERTITNFGQIDKQSATDRLNITIDGAPIQDGQFIKVVISQTGAEKIKDTNDNPILSASQSVVYRNDSDQTAPTVDLTKFSVIDNYNGTADQLQGAAGAVSEGGVTVKAYLWNDANINGVVDAGELETAITLGTSKADGSFDASNIGDLPAGTYQFVITATDTNGNESVKDTTAVKSITLTKGDVPDTTAPTINSATANYDLANPADVNETVTLNDGTLSSIADSTGSLTEGTDYTFDPATGALVIKDSYLTGKLRNEGDSVVLTLTFDEGTANEATLTFTINAIDTNN
jgi:hypothetical protein